MMRILLATDGSGQAEVAQALVGAIRWPAPTTIRLARAIARVAPSLELDEERRAELNGELRNAAEAQLAGAATALARRGRVLERRVVVGDAVDAILEEAAALAADAIVLGGRRLGPVERTLLGSTSAGVIDGATMPVLVARRPELRSLVFGEDGSRGAHDAAAIVAGWPIFGGLPVRVVSVSHTAVPLAAGVAPTMHHEAVAAYRAGAMESRATHRELAEHTAEWLRRSGLLAEGEVREGDPADALVTAAVGSGADCIVLGTRGRRGLARFFLGSVARAVLERAPVSVLVVPPGARRVS